MLLLTVLFAHVVQSTARYFPLKEQSTKPLITNNPNFVSKHSLGAKLFETLSFPPELIALIIGFVDLSSFNYLSFSYNDMSIMCYDDVWDAVLCEAKNGPVTTMLLDRRTGMLLASGFLPVAKECLMRNEYLACLMDDHLDLFMTRSSSFNAVWRTRFSGSVSFSPSAHYVAMHDEGQCTLSIVQTSRRFSLISLPDVLHFIFINEHLICFMKPKDHHSLHYYNLREGKLVRMPRLDTCLKLGYHIFKFFPDSPPELLFKEYNASHQTMILFQEPVYLVRQCPKEISIYGGDGRKYVVRIPKSKYSPVAMHGSSFVSIKDMKSLLVIEKGYEVETQKMKWLATASLAFKAFSFLVCKKETHQ